MEIVQQSGKNTFKDTEFFKFTIYSNSKEKSLLKGSWLTNSKDMWRGYFVCPFHKTKIVASVNWSGSNINQINSTISSECVLIFVDSIQDWATLMPEIIKMYEKIPIKIVVHKDYDEAKNFAKEIKGFSYSGDDAEELKQLVDQLDKNEYEKLVLKFNIQDLNKNGFIEMSELNSLVLDLGEDPKTESFKQSILVFDANKDNKISLEEFIVFWKIGRQNTPTLAKINQFEYFLKENICKIMHYENFLKEINVLRTKIEDKSNKIAINIKTKEQIKIKTRIECKVAVGGVKKVEAVKNFISKFTDNLDPIKENWVNISVFLKSETIDSKIARIHLEEFRENILKYAEQNLIPGLSGFINNFLNIKSYNRECSATVLFRLKFDIESILKDASEAIVKIIESISHKDKGFEANLKVYSEEKIEELFKNNECLKELLKNSEIKFESSSLKALLKTLFLNINQKYQSFLGLFQFLFAPNDLKMDFLGPINELLDQTTASILDLNLSPFAKFINFIKSNLNPILLKSMKRLEIGFNLFDTFFNMQIFSDTLWESDINLTIPQTN